MRSELIFWFRTPPKVSKGAFNYVSQNWGNKVIYVINNDFPEYRKSTNWNDGDFGDAQVIMLSKCENEQASISSIFHDYPNAIHVVSAFTNVIQQKIRKYIFNPGIKLAVFSERPDSMGNFIEKSLRQIYFQYKYRKLHRLFNPYVNVFLPLGQLGVDTFASYGWNRDKMFPFMYNPVIWKNDEPSKRSIIDGKIRFLYVGRFYFKTKGIDTLMRASEKLKGEWQLDLVGGYGKDKDKVLDWVAKQPQVKYLGSWQSQDVCTNMMQYDVVIVPSKYDGWNLLTNEAINAGIGTIVTNEAVSDELITSSGAGTVVAANNNIALAKAMQSVIDKPQMAEKWKENAYKFADLISPRTVGEYFMNIMDYTFINTGQQRPKCPWLQ